MPKKQAKRQDQEAARQRAARREEPDRSKRLLVVGLAALFLLVVVGVIGFGWYQTQIKPLNKTVLRVGDTKFSLDHVERRMSLTLDENTFFRQSEELLMSLPDTVLLQLEREGKLLEAAGELDITVSDEEIAQEVRDRGNLAVNAMSGVYAQVWSQQVEESGLKPDEYQQMLRAVLLEDKVREHFDGLVPETEPQVRGRWLAFSSKTLAEKAVERLEAGEDLDEIAAEPPRDDEDAEDTEDPEAPEPLEVTDTEWSPRGVLGDEALDEFLFGAEPGQFSDPIGIGLNFYVVVLTERDDDRTVDEAQRPQIVNREMEVWFESLDETLIVENDFTDDDTIRALSDILA